MSANNIAADRVAAFIAAFLSNETRHGFPSILTIAGAATNHEDMSLDANDVAELVTPELRLLAIMRVINADARSDDTTFRLTEANEIVRQLDLDEDGLEDLAEKLREVREALDLAADRVGVFLHGERRKRLRAEREARNPRRPHPFLDSIDWSGQ